MGELQEFLNLQKISELQDRCMKRFPSPKLAARMHFFYLKSSVENWTKNVKIRKIANIVETAGNSAKFSKFQS